MIREFKNKKILKKFDKIFSVFQNMININDEKHRIFHIYDKKNMIRKI